MPRFDETIAELPEEAWETVTWREGRKRPMRGQFAALRMHWGKGNQTRSLDDHRTTTSEEGWLIAERPRSGEGETKYYFSNLPARASLKQLAAAVKSRWPTRGSSTKTANSIAASATSRAAAGTACTATSRWRCSLTASSRSPAGRRDRCPFYRRCRRCIAKFCWRC
jgi:hypothetical protein